MIRILVSSWHPIVYDVLVYEELGIQHEAFCDFTAPSLDAGRKFIDNIMLNNTNIRISMYDGDKLKETIHKTGR